MLNDLSRKTSHRPDILLIPRAKRNWVKLSLNMAYWFVLTAIIGFTVVLVIPALKRVEPLASTRAPVASVSLASIQEDMPKQDMLSSHIVALALDEFHASDKSSPMNEAMVKQNISLDDRHDELLNNALDAIQDGDDPRAVYLLTQLLNEFPQSVDARENLAGLYISHGNITEAHALVEEGLKLDSHNLRLSIIKSRSLVELGHHREALTLLEQFNPDINKHPDYYAVLAAIFNALERTNEAGSLYQTLLRMDPLNGQYCLGLGIALEHKHSIQQAIEAYKQASQSEGVQPAVRAYAENRLNVLQG